MVALRSAAISAVAVPSAAALNAQHQQQHTTANEPRQHTPTAMEAAAHRAVMAASWTAQPVVLPKKQTGTPGSTTTVVYQVREGDTLSAIAERELGAADDYPRIFAANKDRLEPEGAHFTDPSLIMPGWSLTLPTTVVKTEQTTVVQQTEHSTGAPVVHKTVHTAVVHKTEHTTVAHKTVRPAAAESPSTGGLSSWINEAISILREHGYDVSYEAVYETAIHESGGDPGSVNESDSNAASGHPSIGLMQTIQSTFDAYALPGHRDIYNPVDNIIAAARYAAAVYGSLDEMVEARCDGSCWRGY